MFIMFSLHMCYGLFPRLQLVLGPDRDGVVEDPGQGRDHARHLPVSQHDAGQVHSYVTTTTCHIEKN